VLSIEVSASSLAHLGKAKLLRDGSDLLVISSGFMTMRSLEVAQQLRPLRTGSKVEGRGCLAGRSFVSGWK